MKPLRKVTSKSIEAFEPIGCSTSDVKAFFEATQRYVKFKERSLLISCINAKNAKVYRSSKFDGASKGTREQTLCTHHAYVI
eukprot:jgi/Botrbrau1/8723/Bobra.0311s0033.1